MILKKKENLKIATILPYKENYSYEKASAASLWVSEFYTKSKFKKNNKIYGSTDSKKYLTPNYINIKLKSINSRFKSTTKEYCEKLTDRINNEIFDIIEIHNRPLIFFNLVKNISSKFIFYFHNDPLSMKGSKKISERLLFLKSADKIIFVSEWVKNRFFLGIDKKLITKTDVIYPSVNLQKKYKKKKIISFVGRLNHSKGYDIFSKAIVKILDEFPKWSSISIGDEDRRSIYVNHMRHKELGFLNHKKTLSFLNRSEIAVVPSRWDEPFGRSALEASSCGCATIISNKGGLIETTNNAIILDKVDELELYKALKNLILNVKLRKKIQLKSRKNILHLISENTKNIDLMREGLFPKYNFNINRNKLKIINLYNQGQKLNHRLYNISLGKKFTNGFIRNNHDVIEISDRDIIKNNRSLNIFSSKNNFQNYLIETFKNYNPDLFFSGHTNNIDLNTLEEIKTMNKNIIVSQWNEDPVMPSLEYSNKNISNINIYSNIVDHNFITTHPSIIEKRLNSDNFNFFFVPVDRNIECFNVFNMRPKNDLFYAMSHGVNRATLKEGIEDNRVQFLDKLIKKIPKIKYDFYGFENRQPIWGNDFNNNLINSKMGLNLSRGNPVKYYSSNRIASIMGNGLMTFIDRKVQMSDFFNNNEIVTYNDINDLSEKIKFYSKNDRLRIKIAKNGKRKYFKLFNETIISKYIIDISIGKKTSLI